jgi:hypothetical protein
MYTLITTLKAFADFSYRESAFNCQQTTVVLLQIRSHYVTMGEKIRRVGVEKCGEKVL